MSIYISNSYGMFLLQSNRNFIFLKTYLANIPIFYPLKTPRNLWFFRGFFFFEGGGDKMGIFPGNGLMERKLGNRTITDILIINLPPCKTRKTKTKSFVNPLMHNVPK